MTWEEPSGIIWNDGPVHCKVVQDGKAGPLCGARLGSLVVGVAGPNWSWADPATFTQEPNKCEDCANHPDLPLLLLGTS